jgi:hypothetical protein
MSKYAKWEKTHQKEIEECERQFGNNRPYLVKHKTRKIPPKDRFIMQYRKFVLHFETGTRKHPIDVVWVEHYV